MPCQIYYAHSLKERPESEWQQLQEHLDNVADMAAEFAAAFDSAEWGRLAGLWHDLGKYSAAFQDYLKRSARDDGSARRGEVDHSTAGAKYAGEQFNSASTRHIGRILAYCIAGHHGGLADWDTDSNGSLLHRLQADKAETLDALRRFGDSNCSPAAPASPPFRTADNSQERAFQISLFTRMIFSCLVDADCLDAEATEKKEQADIRQADLPEMAALERQLDGYLSRLPTHGKVNVCRGRILTACRNAAELEPGLFSLTVPTGGGKSLSSLAFALKHGRIHGLNRVIYAIPYTSIIEQNADQFRKALGPLASRTVVEHHSNFDPRKETDWSNLASENWNAPLVVTTNVQFLESLFACRTSQCRKLHNIVGSTIILDEVQALPVTLLAPTLALLRELTRNYRCTIVLCTATQPAFRREELKIGLGGVREIINEPARLYADMRRTRVETLGPLKNEQLVERLARHRQFLCVVNTKRHAAELYRLLVEKISPDHQPLDGVAASGSISKKHRFVAGQPIHLSALMTARHRSAVLRMLRRQLDRGEPCRVISTQLIEAGVDIDFPVVYRAMAGLDSIAQAAGRCNREGNKKTGIVYVFDAERPPPMGVLQQAADTAGELVGLYDDLLSLEAINHFFRLHFWKREKDWDRREIMDCFKSPLIPNFREAAERYFLIEKNTSSVIIPYGYRGKQLVKQLKARPIIERKDTQAWAARKALNRALQRYSVQLPKWQMDKLKGYVQPVCPEKLEDQYLVLETVQKYSRELGLSTLSAEDMVV